MNDQELKYASGFLTGVVKQAAGERPAAPQKTLGGTVMGWTPGQTALYGGLAGAGIGGAGLGLASWLKGGQDPIRDALLGAVLGGGAGAAGGYGLRSLMDAGVEAGTPSITPKTETPAKPDPADISLWDTAEGETAANLADFSKKVLSPAALGGAAALQYGDRAFIRPELVESALNRVNADLRDSYKAVKDSKGSPAATAQVKKLERVQQDLMRLQQKQRSSRGPMMRVAPALDLSQADAAISAASSELSDLQKKRKAVSKQIGKQTGVERALSQSKQFELDQKIQAAKQKVRTLKGDRRARVSGVRSEINTSRTKRPAGRATKYLGVAALLPWLASMGNWGYNKMYGE